ncbi:MAG: RDD family protein [Bdellovibrionaceae bacterium]|nr:RDD family protein [Pseudobdellovibrionaceae bacterium]
MATQPDPIEFPTVAERGVRLAAMAMDAGICLFVGGFLGAVLRMMKLSEASLASASVQIACMLAFIALPLVSVVKKASPGKIIMGLRLANPQGMDLTVGKILLRETFAKAIGLLLLGPVWIFTNAQNRAAWDFAVGSVVVPERRLSRPPEDEVMEDIPEPGDLSEASVFSKK